jgi:hypothetical protein
LERRRISRREARGSWLGGRSSERFRKSRWSIEQARKVQEVVLFHLLLRHSLELLVIFVIHRSRGAISQMLGWLKAESLSSQWNVVLTRDG